MDYWMIFGDMEKIYHTILPQILATNGTQESVVVSKHAKVVLL